MILFQQTYSSPDQARQAELDLAKSRNELCSAFTNRVYLPGTSKRYTFSEIFSLAVDRFPGDVCVIANSDIAFDESIHEVLSILQPGMLIALTRWDNSTAPSMEGRVDPNTWKFFSHSQDAWIFLAGSLPSFDTNFSLGIPRCENRLAYEATAAGVIVVNPALSIRTWHHHSTMLRTWQVNDYYRGPLFFPRLTSAAFEQPEGFVLSKRPHLELVVQLDGTQAGFHQQLAAEQSQPSRRTHSRFSRSFFKLLRGN